MQIFGKNWTRSELERRIGNVGQIGGTRHVELVEGAAKGVRAIECNCGTGLAFTVLPDRGMDISLASYCGTNLVHLTPTGEVHPSFYSPAASEWLRLFFAGLLTTCGLTHFGPPGRDGDDDLGLHGRATMTPAKRVNDLSGWDGDEYVIEIRGTLEDAFLFGDKIRLERRIRSRIGSRSLEILDTVTNFGYKPSPFNILYHINPGFPLLDAGTELLITSRRIEPYCEKSRKNIDAATRFTAPEKNYIEENFLHEMIPDSDGLGHCALINPNLGNGLGLRISFSVESLPFLSEWKMMGEGDYVVGLEPVNVRIENRAILRKEGLLPFLKPGESRTMRVEIGILDGIKEIEAFPSKAQT